MNSQSQPSQALHPRSLPQQDAALGAMPVLSTQELFQGRQEIAIEHAGAIYRLRITRQGKLILNK